MLCDYLQLVVDTYYQYFALLQRLPRHPGALGMTPHRFIRIQIRCVIRQEMLRQTTFGCSHIVPNDLALVLR